MLSGFSLHGNFLRNNKHSAGMRTRPTSDRIRKYRNLKNIKKALTTFFVNVIFCLTTKVVIMQKILVKRRIVR